MHGLVRRAEVAPLKSSAQKAPLIGHSLHHSTTAGNAPNLSIKTS